MSFSELASKDSIQKTLAALKANNIDAYFAENIPDAKKKLFELIPQNSNVMTMTSTTLDAMNIPQEIDDSASYKSVRKKLTGMSDADQGSEKRALGAAPDFVVGSVHAVTEDGTIMIASATGSQLSAHAFGAGKVIFVIGAQKIVKDRDEGFKRIYEYSLPLESERAKKAYGVPGSAVNKLLIINKEYSPGRITVVLVNQVLGF